MSSLMQHHGSTTSRVKPGRVELLMYKTHQKETKPLSCSNCGCEWHEGDRKCRGCGRFVLFVYKYPPHGEKENLLETQDAMKFPEYKECRSQDDTCSVSNWWRPEDSEPVKLTRPDGSETTCPKLYRVWRKPKGMWGCWVVFVWNGEEHVPDLSTPIAVEKLPRDAEALTDEEAAGYWFTP
jgi:hypothetical protein